MTAAAGYQTCVRIVCGIYCRGVCAAVSPVIDSRLRYTDVFVFSICITSPGIVWGHITVNFPPNLDSMKHAMSGHDYSIPLRGLLTASAHVLCLVGPPVVASGPICKRARVLNTRGLSRHCLRAHYAKRTSGTADIPHQEVPSTTPR